ncbi:Gap junction alpha-9 protein Connexin-58 [Larimichthys crocea]|uniref:Gap junction protein n=1 Tax=Larimichthys crocea TaxID=215358 RepID=A0A6G0HTG9_LARCR|nr:Gap junction alpha-9 protein Connexin-58 [Larimichthys crocea]
MVGKIWLTILFIFRMLVLGVAAEDVWNDEQSDFICNTEQPGCRTSARPGLPHLPIRYWVLQVIFVSSPSLVYMGHAIYQLRALEKERHCKKVALRREMEAVDVELVEVRRRIEKEMRQLEQGKLNKAPLRGSLLCTYVAHIVTRSVVEVSFMMGQFILYGHRLSPLYKCEREPCPNVVDCFVSRPTEKTVFMMFMQAIACISLFLSLLEIIHLGFRKLKMGILDYYPHLKDDLDDYYVNKSQKNSVVHQVCKGTSVGRKTTIPTAPCGGPRCKAGHPQGQQGRSAEPTEQNSNSNNTSSETRSPPEPQEHPSPHHEDMESAGSEYPTLPVADTASCTTLSGIARKARRVGPSWNCSTLVEGNGSDSKDLYHRNNSMKLRSSCVGPRARMLSKSDIKRPSRPQSPDSPGELSSVSRHSRESNSPTASSPNRRVSAASSGSSRRAPTDLQI